MIDSKAVNLFKPEDSVMVSKGATEYFCEMLSDENNTVRILLVEDGCSGFKYEFIKERFSAPSNGDLIIKLKEGRYLIIDGDFKSLMMGTHIKLLTNGINKEIVLENPNVIGQCGCGESVLFNEK